MKMKTKVAIFLAAVLLTFVGFNLIVTPSTLEAFNVGKLSGYEIVVTAQALPAQPARNAG
jgi:hypothetical protein